MDPITSTGRSDKHEVEESRCVKRKERFLCLLTGGSREDVVSYIEECLQCDPKKDHSYITKSGSCFLAEAILSGRFDIVEYLSKRFPTEVRQFLESAPADLQESPFHSACRLYDAEMVRLLITCGASVHLPDTHGLPPLHAAIAGGRVDVLDALLENGASINQEDSYGWSPLCVAMSKPEMVPPLLRRGADVNRRVSSGHTALHLAAQRGSRYLEAYVTAADFMSMAPVFREEVPPAESRRNEDHVPCPLFLAAANGHRLLVRVLAEHPECPPSCKADALLLLCIAECLVNDSRLYCQLVLSGGDLVEGWMESLYFREANNLELPRLPPIPAYGNRIEVSTIQELEAIQNSEEEMLFQSLIVYERCLGYRRHNRELTRLLCSAINYCLGHNKRQQCNLLLEKALGLEVCLLTLHPSSICIAPSTYMTSNLFKFHHWLFLHVMVQLRSGGHKIGCYTALVRATVSLIEEMRRCCKKSVSLEDMLHSTVLTAVNMLYEWHNNLGPGDSEDFQQLGEWFVSANLRPVKGVTLLHCIYRGMPTMRLLTEAGVATFSSFMAHILSWGAVDVIDEPNSLGGRPLHYAHKAAKQLGIPDQWEDIVSHLVEHGAHKDAVDQEGFSVPFHPGSLIRLSCLASRMIASSGLPYKNLGLPAHIIRLISFHVKNSISE